MSATLLSRRESVATWPAPTIEPVEHGDDASDDGIGDDVDVPALTPRLQIARGVLVMLAVLSGAFLAQLVVLSRFQHAADQQRAFDEFRLQLAEGTVPVGPLDADDELLPLGTPIALLEIPRFDVEEVIGEGTDAATLAQGPGHRRDTVFPGQLGVSVLFGRRAAYGGPFGRIDQLEAGDEIIVTTGQGEFEYAVTAVRREGDPIPDPVGADGARLTLATADGTPFVPSGVIRVDAELVAPGVVGAGPAIAPASLPDAERAMATDFGSPWLLAFWLQALLILSVGAVWCWHRWHRGKTWVVAVPPLMLIGLATAGELIRLLPNLM